MVLPIGTASPAAAASDGTIVTFDQPVFTAPAYASGVTATLHARYTDGTAFVGDVCYSWTVGYWLEAAWETITTDAAGVGTIYVYPGGSPTAGHLTAYANRLNQPCGTLSPTDVPGSADVIVSPLQVPPVSGYPSDSCTDSSGQVLDGYAGGHTYVKLRSQLADADTTWVCLRVEGPTFSYGARFTVDVAAPGLSGLPSVDDSASACTTTAGNAVPGEHPLVAGAVGDPANLAYQIDTYSSSGGTASAKGAWVCVGVGSFQKRVIVPSVDLVWSTVLVTPDPPGAHAPPLAFDPVASSTCGADGGQMVVDASSAGGTHAYLYTLTDLTSGAVKVCARAENGTTFAGGVLTVASAGVLPGVTIGSDPATCSTLVAEQGQPSQAAFKIGRSPTGAVPASVCLTANGVTHTVTVSPGNNTTPVTWTPDAA